MGLDVTIKEYKGISNTFLIMESPNVDLPYTTDRLYIRHELSKHIEFDV